MCMVEPVLFISRTVPYCTGPTLDMSGSFSCSVALERESRGSKLAGKVTNFKFHNVLWYSFLYKELMVCRVTSGGCGHGA